MKTITIDVPQDGTSVQFLVRGTASPTQAVIVTGDDVEVQQGSLIPEIIFTANSDASTGTDAATKDSPLPADLQIIYATLLEQRVKRRTAAVNVIKTMFQFTKPITTARANQIFDELRKRGYLTMTPTGTIEFPKQQEIVQST